MGSRMNEFVTAEIICNDRDGNEIVVYEISIERNCGSRSQPDIRLNKDRYETADKSSVTRLDGSTFQVVKNGLIMRIAKTASACMAASLAGAVYLGEAMTWV
jgi:hypothetical protein